MRGCRSHFCTEIRPPPPHRRHDSNKRGGGSGTHSSPHPLPGKGLSWGGRGFLRTLCQGGQSTSVGVEGGVGLGRALTRRGCGGGAAGWG